MSATRVPRHSAYDIQDNNTRHTILNCDTQLKRHSAL
jgi:hypothetical protein